MPIGLDEALGLTGLSLSLLHGCVQGLTLLSKAKPHRYHRDICGLRLQIELEQYKLFTWAEKAGLIGTNPTLRMDIGSAVHVPKILKQLYLLVCDLTKLRSRYPELVLDEISEDVEGLVDDDAALTNLGVKLPAYIRRVSVAIFQQRKHPWKRLRWSAFGEIEAKSLLAEIKGYTEQLDRFLEPSLKAEWLRDQDVDLRDAIMNSDDHQTLEIIGAESKTSAEAGLLSVARLKQIRLKIEGHEPSTRLSTPTIEQQPRIRVMFHKRTSSNSLHSMRLHMTPLTISRATVAPEHLRILTWYDDTPVMLEWKRWEGSDSAKLERRVDGVAAFLSRLEPSLHSLACQGYVKNTDFQRYGYIFALPNTSLPPPLKQASLSGRRSTSRLPDLRTLRGLFDQMPLVPSLDVRLGIALIVLETLLNLHTSGWIHKQFRSDNIIFIGGKPQTEDLGLELADYSVYVAGYGYARADEPGEMTEALSSEAEADLYRHPMSLGMPRLPFCRSFDVFSVGCVLLEIGLWSGLRHILMEQLFVHSAVDGPTSSMRTYSRPSFAYKRGEEEDNDDDDKINLPFMVKRRMSSANQTTDLMNLRNELLLSGIQNTDEYYHGKEDTEPILRSKCNILRSLAAVTGSAYTKIVEKFLSGHVPVATQEASAAEDGKEHALALETEAVNTVRGLLKALRSYS